MKALTTVLVVLLSQGALADGFECQTADQDLTVKVYNHVNPNDGTRTAHTMILSDPAVSAGRKTIARFTDEAGNLVSSGSQVTGNVDLRFNDSSRKGELIGGTKLGELSEVVLDVDFSFTSPVEHGEELAAGLTLVKRNGDQIELDLICARYLKGN